MSATILDQVALSSFLVADTLFFVCQAPRAVAVSEAELAVGGDADDLLREHDVRARGA